jgi:predicted acyl esterase
MWHILTLVGNLLLVFGLVNGHESRSQTIMVKMRDGTELHTVIHLPREDIKSKGPKFPTIMDRSPYGYR